MRTTQGKVYLVGAGAAGRDLITVRGLGILQQANVVIYDYLTDRALLAEIKEGAESFNCRDFGKDREGTSKDAQDKINGMLVSRARQGKMVVRLKNGDPMIFGRASEELEALRKARIEFEIVPGISAAQAAAAYSGIPLTDRSSAKSVVFVTGHQAQGETANPVDWKSISANGTIVLYMAVKTIPRIAATLIQAGKPANTPVAAISHAGRIEQTIVISRLKAIASDVKKGGIVSPAVFIIGDVVLREKAFNWFKKNQRILYTGTSGHRTSSRGTVFQQALIQIKPIKDYTHFDKHLCGIDSFDWVIFTSRHSVQYFFERLAKVGRDSRALHGVGVAAIGTMTAKRLLDFGITADLISRQESSRGLLAALKRSKIEGKRIFFPRSNIADKELPLQIRELGAKVVTSAAYRNVSPEGLPNWEAGFFDEIVFTSPSGVRNFIKRYGHPPRKVKIRCIGGVTRAQAKQSRVIA